MKDGGEEDAKQDAAHHTPTGSPNCGVHVVRCAQGGVTILPSQLGDTETILWLVVSSLSVCRYFAENFPSCVPAWLAGWQAGVKEASAPSLVWVCRVLCIG